MPISPPPSMENPASLQPNPQVHLLAEAPARSTKVEEADSFPIPSEQILQTFLDLVRIPSPSGQEEQVRAYLETRLQQLGISKQDKTLLPNQASYVIDSIGNLIIHVPSNVSSGKPSSSKHSSRPTLLMNAHMDVVPPCLNIRPVIKIEPDSSSNASTSKEARVVYSAGDTVLGGDDKSALAPMLEALAYSLKNNQARRPNLLIIWTVQEEVGGLGAAKMDPHWYTQGDTQADLAIAFDINGEQGTVVYQAPQLTLWDADVLGKSAHAGIEPEKGINALKATVLAAAQIPTGRLDSETTINIGKIQSGEKFNIVPGKAQLSGEVRSFDPKRVDQELSNIQQALTRGTQQVPGTSFQFQEHTVIHAYKVDLAQPIFTPLKNALTQTGLPFLPIRTTGGSDVNVFAQHGIPSVVLSGAYYHPHQTNEFVRVRDMALQAKLILNLWQAYAQE